MASNSDSCGNQEDERTIHSSSSWYLAKEEQPSGENYSSCSNVPGGAAQETDSSIDRNAEEESSSDDGTITELQEFRDNHLQLETRLQTLETNYYRDHAIIMQALEEESSRQDVLTKDLADLTERHQDESLKLKRELARMKTMMEVFGDRVLNLEEQEVQRQTEMRKPRPSMLEKLLNVRLNMPLVISSAAFLVLLFALGHFHLEWLNVPSAP